MIDELINKQITIPLSEYKRLIEDGTRYNQLFKWQLKHENDDILRTIDDKKYKEETKERLFNIKDESEEN